MQLSVPTFLTLNVDFMFDIERLYLAVDYEWQTLTFILIMCFNAFTSAVFHHPPTVIKFILILLSEIVFTFYIVIRYQTTYYLFPNVFQYCAKVLTHPLFIYTLLEKWEIGAAIYDQL